jgi:hypothetical protein
LKFHDAPFGIVRSLIVTQSDDTVTTGCY